MTCAYRFHRDLASGRVAGIVGAVVGGWLAGMFLNLKDPTGINVETIVVSVVGALIVVFVWNLLFGGRRGAV